MGFKSQLAIAEEEIPADMVSKEAKDKLLWWRRNHTQSVRAVIYEAIEKRHDGLYTRLECSGFGLPAVVKWLQAELALEAEDGARDFKLQAVNDKGDTLVLGLWCRKQHGALEKAYWTGRERK